MKTLTQKNIHLQQLKTLGESNPSMQKEADRDSFAVADERDIDLRSAPNQAEKPKETWEA